MPTMCHTLQKKEKKTVGIDIAIGLVLELAGK